MKRKEIAEQKQLLSIVQEKEEPVQEPQEQVSEKRPELSEDNLSFVKQWMECKISSKKEYYEYLIEEVRNKTEGREISTVLQHFPQVLLVYHNQSSLGATLLHGQQKQFLVKPKRDSFESMTLCHSVIPFPPCNSNFLNGVMRAGHMQQTD
ncbi:hypothetical protein TNCV_25421 [Trichonephila clavipes]|uniref:Uncharacterized protein n=1 Tax=Trichonephila clavipes TaxID=2585209 RepID=A0A8X6W165_TRICX|nr:hypothetical protein TNCV_25421 [Trichonephila clavipes]